MSICRNAAELMGRYRSMLLHLAGGFVVLLVWRFMSLPSPDSLGLLIPLAWILTGLIQGSGGFPKHSPLLLSAFLLFSVFWTAGPVPELLTKASALAGTVPGLLAAVQRTKHGWLLALVPLLPIIITRVPFVHDEPFYSTRTEEIVAPDAEVFGSLHRMYGDPTETLRHHQPFYPALLIPGYWFGETGVRLVNVIMALGAALLLGSVLRREGLMDWRFLVILGFLTVPGIDTLGIVYPEWLAIAIFCWGILLVERKRGLLWTILVTLLLALIKERFALLGIGLILFQLRGKSPRTRNMVLLIGTALVVSILLLDLYVLSGRLFIIRYVNMSTLRTLICTLVLRLPIVLLNTLSALIDVEGGILWKAPWILLALAGLPALRRTHPHAFRLLVFPSITYTVVYFLWKTFDWHGFPTPCGRMLTPLLPLFLASISQRLGSRHARLLIALSLAVSVLHIVSPGLRFNDADGTDILFSTLVGPLSGSAALFPSWIRPELIPFAVWSLLSVILVMLAAKGRKGTGALLLSSAVILGSLASRPQTVWEAEDLPGEYVTNCRLYPPTQDPMFRRYWKGSQELMLEMTSPSDVVTLPVPENAGDSILVRINCRTNPLVMQLTGVSVQCGEVTDSVALSSDIMEMPFWYTFQKGTTFPEQPAHATELQIELSFPNPGSGSEVSIRPYGAPVYLDRLELL